jgi:Ca2+-binding RTX toxin-like protein
MKTRVWLCLAAAAALVLPATAVAGHGLDLLDHPAPSFSEPAPLSSTVNSGGPGARWELITTIPTGNPHTDLDFFTRGGRTYAAVGTLAGGPNGGGQTIIQLTDQEGNVEPAFVKGHPSATCISNPSAALGLQHDVEAAPKGRTILNTDNPFAIRSDTQILIDATDQRGRCHDQGVLGFQQAPRGGLEIIDVTDPANPKEIGLTSHIGEAHTVNVDPKRPHIAYAVTSDAVEVKDTGQRDNENATDTNQAGAIEPNPDRFDLDGFEVVDLSSCMNFAEGTTIAQKRMACRPQVYRYRYPTKEMALGHTQKTGGNGVFGCHELEVYPDDRLTCGSGNALIVLDMSGAFDNNGTPNDFSDDRPRGQPLPCQVRASSSQGPFATGAQVVDCVDGLGSGTEDLSVPNWLNSGAPSLEGVQWIGSIHHQGRGAGGVGQTFDATQDIDFNHEAELSGSGRLLLATDERGGGVQPPGASCTPAGDNPVGNGGVHFYRYEGLHTNGPLSPQQEHQAYARTPDGKKAIFRAPIRTQPRGTVCTAHVFQQVPGQNRIFMGWYSQGTRVIDFVENPDGTVSFKQAGFFIPENANEWVSHVFKTEQHADCTVTYWGATGDFNLGEAGRNAIDIYKVTLPPPPLVAGSGPCGLVSGGQAGAGGQPGGACAQRIRGTNKRDRLLGSIAGDTINALRGKDTVKARAGDDCVKGGGGRDVAAGNAGKDQLKGGGARDRLKGGAGGDQLRDTLSGRDVLNGGKGRDRLQTRGGGRDVVACGPGRDRAVVNKVDRTVGCERVSDRARGR